MMTHAFVPIANRRLPFLWHETELVRGSGDVRCLGQNGSSAHRLRFRILTRNGPASLIKPYRTCISASAIIARLKGADPMPGAEPTSPCPIFCLGAERHRVAGFNNQQTTI